MNFFWTSINIVLFSSSSGNDTLISSPWWLCSTNSTKGRHITSLMSECWIISCGHRMINPSFRWMHLPSFLFKIISKLFNSMFSVNKTVFAFISKRTGNFILNKRLCLMIYPVWLKSWLWMNSWLFCRWFQFNWWL